MKRRISAPINICLFLTEVCNLRCEWCLNFWRHNDSRKSTMSKEQFDRLLEMFLQTQISYVVLNGGEPMSKASLLEYAMKRLRECNIAYTVNSNLTLANEDNLKRLIDVGLEHFLTTFICDDPKIFDSTVGVKGTFNQTVKGIELAVKLGVRVDANMVIGRQNRERIYSTGLLVHQLGCDKFFGTRLVPTPTGEKIDGTAKETSREEALYAIDELLRVKQKTGIMVGSLVSYPLCLLGDLEKYKDFVTRGCPSQSGRRMSIYANGDYSACPHEPKFYGNVFDEGLIKAWNNIKGWRENKYHFTGCKGCKYIDVCSTGCRTSSLAYYGTLNKQDPLMIDKNNFSKEYQIIYDDKILNDMKTGTRFTVPKRIKFRQEENYYLVNIRWGNTISVENDIALLLQKYQKKQESFTLEEFGKNKIKTMVKLFFKDVIESDEIICKNNKNRVGLSVDPDALK